MMWYGHDLGGWGYALMVIGMLAFWGLLVVGIALLIRGPGRSGPTDGGIRNPEQVLAERFADGQIDQKEYTDRLTTLRGVRS